MFFYTNQRKIIQKLNEYAQYHNLPASFNPKGICNGLSHLYAKYRVQGKEAEFIDLLHYIVSTETDELTDRVQAFAIQVLLACEPELFNKKLNQSTANQALEIDGQPLKNAFELAIVTSDLNWKSIIQDINIDENEVLLVHGYRHAVALSKSNGKYVLYDPNNYFVHSIADNEDQLLPLLRACFIQEGKLGLKVKLLQHPSSTREIGFDAKDILRQFLTVENINEKSGGGGVTTLDLTLASSCNDVTTLNMLLNMGAKTSESLGFILTFAVARNSPPQILHRLIILVKERLIHHENHEEGEAEKLLSGFFCSLDIALEYGREEMFNLLYEHPVYKEISEIFPWQYNKLVVSAARGGNAALLAKMIREYKNKAASPEKRIAVLMDNQETDLIDNVIDSGNLKCLALVLEELKRENYQLSDEQRLKYISKAIHANNFHLVRKLVSEMPAARLQTLQMPLSVVEHTVAPILTLLQESGVEFSPNAKSIIANKKHQGMDLVSWILIIIEKIKDYFLSNKSIHYETTLLPAADNNENSISPLVQQSIFSQRVEPLPVIENPLIIQKPLSFT